MKNKASLVKELQVQLDQLIRLLSSRKSPSRVLTYSEARVLSLVSRYSDSSSKVSLSDLTKLSSLAPSALSQLLRTLETRELITREPSTIDRRAVFVSLTSEGKKLAHGIDKELARNTEGLVETLGEEDAAVFSDLLTKVIDYQEQVSRRL